TACPRPKAIPELPKNRKAGTEAGESNPSGTREQAGLVLRPSPLHPCPDFAGIVPATSEAHRRPWTPASLSLCHFLPSIGNDSTKRKLFRSRPTLHPLTGGGHIDVR